MQRFNETPAQKKTDEVRARINFIDNQIKLLNNKKRKLNKLVNDMSDRVNDEGNKVADQLDKECPDWRMILVNSLNK